MSGLAQEFALKPITSTKRRRREERSGDGKHHVYFVRLCAGGLVKIGFTKSIKHRLTSIADDLGVTSSDLQVMGYLRVELGCGRAVEKAIHAALASYRREGEWFDVDQVNLMDTALTCASNVVGNAFSIHGLAHDETFDLGRERWHPGKRERNQVLLPKRRS